MEPVHIPRRVDEYPHLLFWPMDEALLPTTGIFIGVTTNFFWPSIIIGLLAAYYYGKYKKGKPEQYIIHVLYNVGIKVSKSKTFINPRIRRLFP